MPSTCDRGQERPGIRVTSESRAPAHVGWTGAGAWTEIIARSRSVEDLARRPDGGVERGGEEPVQAGAAHQDVGDRVVDEPGLIQERQAIQAPRDGPLE